MQKISVQNLKQGMKTYSRLRTADGRILLGSSIRLTDTYIKRIQSMGIHNLAISNPILERAGLIYEETLPEDKKTEAIKTLKRAFDDAGEGKVLDIDSISMTARMILESVRLNQIIRLDNDLVAEDYVYGHCLNVAALTAVIGHDMDYNIVRMRGLIMGALLHDIGKVLDDSAKEEEHPSRGFAYVRKIRKYSTLSAHVVYAHHEKYDGTGFPRGIAGDKIHEYARITAVADVYDRLVSSPEPGKECLLPHQAYEAVMALSSSYLDKRIADLFLMKAPLYPVGSFVVLDRQYIGIVTDVRPKMQARPTVLLIGDMKGKFFEEWFEMKMTDNLTTFISHIMSEEEVIALTERYKKSAVRKNRR
jgi:putative nucleotidyltransferase with HDIG domain